MSVAAGLNPDKLFCKKESIMLKRIMFGVMVVVLLSSAPVGLTGCQSASKSNSAALTSAETPGSARAEYRIRHKRDFKGRMRPVRERVDNSGS